MPAQNLPDDAQILEALCQFSSALVSDALDQMGLRHHMLPPRIRPLTPGPTVAGRAVPARVVVSTEMPLKPYEGEMHAVDSLRPGDIPVYIAAPGVDAAVWGELFSCAAIGRGAVGAVIDGPIRDARQVRELRFPVFATSFSPLDTQARAVVQDLGQTLRVGDVQVARGDYVLADEDGIVIVPQSVAATVIAAVTEKARKERKAYSDLLNGASIFEVWDRYRVL